MLDKAAQLAKCLRSQASEKVIVQDQPCNKPRFDKFKASCRGCEEKETCSFMGLRGFKVSKKTGRFSHGPYFPPTNKHNPLRKLKSLHFNTKPPSQNAPSYAMNKIKSVFHKVLLRQKKVLKDFLNAPIRRENPEGYRHFCDSCYTSLFNYHFICSTCGLEICPDCYDQLTTASDSALTDCTKGDKHLKEVFVLVSKLPEDSTNQLIQDTAPENAISDDEQYTNTNNEVFDNNDYTNNKYKNQINNQQSSKSAVEFNDNNTFSSADIQCTNDNKNNTNVNSSTVNNTYQSEPISTPIPNRIQNNYTDITHISQQIDTLYHKSSINVDTHSQQTQTIPILDNMDIDTAGFGTGNMFEPCYINNIKFVHTSNSVTFQLPSAFASTKNANYQDSNSSDRLKKISPELFYKIAFFNKRPPQADFCSSDMIRRKRRVITNNSLNCHISDPPNSFYMNMNRQDNNYNQMPQVPRSIYSAPSVLPLSLTPTHYIYPELQPYDLLNNSQDHELHSAFSGYTGPKDQCIPRVIKSPKSRRPFLASPVPPTPALSQGSSSSTTPASPADPRMLITTASALTTESFRAYWQSHQPIMISESTSGSTIKWTPELFEKLCENEILEATDIDGDKFEVSGKDYFAAFSDLVKRKELCSSLGSTKVLKVKDLPPNKALKTEYPDLYQDFMKSLVIPEYCTADGYFNLANRLPKEYLPPDLGPKLFISYGSDESGKTGRTNLHCDITDAVNAMYYADNNTSNTAPVASALWHIFPYESFEKVCSYISDHKEIDSLHPILDHAFYLDQEDLKALKQEYNVVPFTLYQNPGDTVYIPAGCAHQVTNYSNSIKCAYDFISPENVDQSIYISECFRSLKKEDKLQIATTLAFAWTSLKSDEI